MADRRYYHRDGIVIHNVAELPISRSNGKRDRRMTRTCPIALRILTGTVRSTVGQPLRLVLAIQGDVHHMLFDDEHEEGLYQFLNKRRNKRLAWQRKRAKERAIWDAGAPARIAARAAQQETANG